MNQVNTDPRHLRQAFGRFPSGVTAVCALGENQPIGMAASSFTSVSVAPPLVSVCVQNTSETWPQLRDLPRLGLSVLAEGQEDICRGLSKKGVDRFANVDWDKSPLGSVFVLGASLWLDCTVQAEVPAGDHAIVVLEIQGLHFDNASVPLIYHGSKFRRLAEI